MVLELDQRFSDVIQAQIFFCPFAQSSSVHWLVLGFFLMIIMMAALGIIHSNLKKVGESYFFGISFFERWKFSQVIPAGLSPQTPVVTIKT